MKRTILLSITAVAIAVSACSTASPTPAPATAAPATIAPATMAPATMAPSMDVPATASPSMAAEMGDIVDTATAAGTFTTLLTAATAAGLVETLQGEGPYTVFAPTDEAFAALPEGTLEGLLADPEALKQILLYHVVSGKVTADQVVDLTSADSVAGPAIAITVKDGSVYLNDGAKVVTTDIETSNGVIHVIDAVILPPAS